MSNYIAAGDAAPDPLTTPPAGLPPGTTTYTPPTDYTPFYILAGGGLLWALFFNKKRGR